MTAPRAAALSLLIACGATAVEPEEAPARTTCAFTLDPEPPPTGELFAVHVEVRIDGQPVNEAEVTIDATMPDHGHGMLTAPRTVQVGDGVYRATGMKLHMPGDWELTAHVRGDHGEETCRTTWRQPPQPSR